MSTRRCCSMPHGQLTLWAGILGTFAFILSDAALGTCRYAIRTRLNGESSHGIGLYSWEEYDPVSGYYYCVTANVATRGYDAAWTAARAMAGIAVAMGFICMVMTWCATCMVYPTKAWKLLGLGNILASISVICTMSFFGSWACENGCKFSAGASVALVACLLYAICACFCFKMPPAKPEEEDTPGVAVAQGAAPGTVTTTETVQPDGTRIVEKVTVNADGSRTVERTVEKPADGAAKA